MVWALEAVDLVRRVRHAGREIAVIDRVGFLLAPGRTLGITGPADAGHRSLLRALAGLDPLSSGSISLLDRPDRRAPRFADIALFRQEVIHAALLEPLLDSGMAKALREISRLAVTRHRGVRLPDAGAVLRFCGLSSDTRVGDLEPAPRRCLAIALGAVLRPAHLLIDVVDLILDVRERALLVDLLRRVSASGAGIVLAARDDLLLASVVDRLMVLTDGAVLAEGTAPEVIPAAAAAVVRANLPDSETRT